MIKLTNKLSYDEQQPYELQTPEVLRYLDHVMTTEPKQSQSDDCGNGLLRFVREVWDAGAEGELIRVHEYANPPQHAACFALRSQTFILRYRLL
jgi:hypothetical protein